MARCNGLPWLESMIGPSKSWGLEDAIITELGGTVVPWISSSRGQSFPGGEMSLSSIPKCYNRETASTQLPRELLAFPMPKFSRVLYLLAYQDLVEFAGRLIRVNGIRNSFRALGHMRPNNTRVQYDHNDSLVL